MSNLMTIETELAKAFRAQGCDVVNDDRRFEAQVYDYETISRHGGWAFGKIDLARLARDLERALA